MAPWFDVPANPSAAHRLGRDAAMAVDRARDQVAALLGWPAAGVVFTSGASESNGTVLSRGRWAATAVEHPSVRLWASALLPVDGRGLVDLDSIDEISGVDGVSVMLANNETGVVQPIDEVVARAHARGLLIHVDAAQAPGRVDLSSLARADFVTISSHKLGGPAGAGALCVPKGAEAAPLLRGASQERGWRAGTHNVAAIVGFGAAAEAVHREPLFIALLRDELEAGLQALGGSVAGEGAPRLPNTTCVAFAGVLAPDFVAALDLAGVAASAGSACASGAARPSDVLAAMGFPGSAVRFSLGRANTRDDVLAVLAAVRRCLPALRENG